MFVVGRVLARDFFLSQHAGKHIYQRGSLFSPAGRWCGSVFGSARGFSAV